MFKPPNHGLEPTGLISALFNCSTRFWVSRLTEVVFRTRPAAQPKRYLPTMSTASFKGESIYETGN